MRTNTRGSSTVQKYLTFEKKHFGGKRDGWKGSTVCGRFREYRLPSLRQMVTVPAWIYLGLVAGFTGGVLTMHFQTWPYSVMSSIYAFVKGDPDETSSLTEKIASELTLNAAVLRVPWTTGVDRTLLRPVQHPSLRDDIDPPLVYTTSMASRYPKAMMTMSLFHDAPLSVILLDHAGIIRHRWDIREDFFDRGERGAGAYYGGDFVILDDGSLIAFISNRSGLLRIGFSGQLMWRTDGFFHHHVSLTEDGFLWILGKPGTYESPEMRRKWNSTELMNKIDVRDGRVVKTIRLIDIMRRNLDRLDPFFAHEVEAVANPDGLLSEDLWHVNDVEVLPASMADRFPAFAAGDLALCFRLLNLILVIHPETLEIKWWSQGVVQLPHDPDWLPDGTLSIFNNRHDQNAEAKARHNFSAIQRFDFRDPLPETVIDGADYQFFTAHSGWHDTSPDGRVLIASTVQARVFEVDPDRAIAMEFIHRFRDDEGFWAGSARYADPALLDL